MFNKMSMKQIWTFGVCTRPQQNGKVLQTPINSWWNPINNLQNSKQSFQNQINSFSTRNTLLLISVFHGK